MKRLTLHLSIALLTFCLGISAWFVNPLGRIHSRLCQPLRIRVLSKTELVMTHGDRVPAINVLVENVGKKTVRGYALRYESENGYGATVPQPDLQILRPGESQIRAIPFLNEDIRVWADFVNFEDKTTWGPNQTRSEGYVRW